MQMTIAKLTAAVVLCLFSTPYAVMAAQGERWSEQKAQDWYNQQAPLLLGANFTPSNAVNQLEMWQADTFDADRIDQELGWAAAIGMNTMRVFLHDLAYKQDPDGFKQRLETFLQLCSKHRIKPMLVLFDSCWDPFPAVGRQSQPRPGIHNSGWVQSPGAIALSDTRQHARLEAYVKGVVGAFQKDERILAWGIWNEPDNTNDSSYGASEPANKVELVQKLLPKAFEWARSVNPVQPLTSDVWKGDYSTDDKLDAVQRIQLNNSDVISFHSYDNPADFELRIKWLSRFKRPIMCTEYMARGNNSTFSGSLSTLKKYKVAGFNWGLVAGKTQTFLPWDSWQNPYVGRQPKVWFHDVFRVDGTPYDPAETQLIKQVMTTRMQ